MRRSARPCRCCFRRSARPAIDLVLVETPGTGQTGLDLGALRADLLVYLKTREFGSSLQLQKDQLLRDADLVVLNKADLEGAETAFGELRSALDELGKETALFPTTAKAARDPGLDELFSAICQRLGWPAPQPAPVTDIFRYAKQNILVPHRRRAYLAEIADKVRAYDRWVDDQLQTLRAHPGDPARLDPACVRLLEAWPRDWQELSRQAADGMENDPSAETPNGLRLPRVALPDPADRAESLRFLLEEGLPGRFPFATGIYPYRTLSAGDTTRQFAGLRGPEETNRRLHLLARGVAKPRLSIAFDGITLYGADSDEDPGSIGKIGEGGVAIDTWEDMKLVLDGFSIPDISTSMTINGPGADNPGHVLRGGPGDRVGTRRTGTGAAACSGRAGGVASNRPCRPCGGPCRPISSKRSRPRTKTSSSPTSPSGSWATYRNGSSPTRCSKFYSLSISGYHIGEAGASPVQELAFTLANGFTYVENFLARGMAINAFAPSLSFFFKVSHEAEWLAYGAVCRKIWAIALRDVYGADERSQRFKFHTQTSGRALQAEEWDTLNPVRLTYHALVGLLANTNSLHVDSADEPMTTPGEKWVRQATMIQNYLREEAEGFLIQNLLSGSYAFRALMKEVQAQILEEFDRLDQLGGVGPATEQGLPAALHRREQHQVRAGTAPGDNGTSPNHPSAGSSATMSLNSPTATPDKYPPVAEVVRPGPADWERQLARLRASRSATARMRLSIWRD